MVIKAETCFYTEYKIFPGHGIMFVRKDGKLLHFINAKAKSLYDQKIKAQKLTWTQAWRRRNKKGKVDGHTRTRKKKTGKIYKSIQGVSVDEIKARRKQKPEHRSALREKALREVKERKKIAKKAGRQAAPKTFAKVPKHRKNMKPTSR